MSSGLRPPTPASPDHMLSGSTSLLTVATRIVNVSSVAGKIGGGTSGTVAYATSKSPDYLKREGNLPMTFTLLRS